MVGFSMDILTADTVLPKTRTDWKLNKINTNSANDVKATKALKKKGWNMIIIWNAIKAS